jgi:hypothetical protein
MAISVNECPWSTGIKLIQFEPFGKWIGGFLTFPYYINLLSRDVSVLAFLSHENRAARSLFGQHDPGIGDPAFIGEQSANL